MSAAKTDYSYNQWGFETSKEQTIGENVVNDTIIGPIKKVKWQALDMSNNTAPWLLGFVKKSKTTSTIYQPNNAISTSVTEFTAEPGTTDVKTTTIYSDTNQIGKVVTIQRNSNGMIEEVAESAENASGIYETRVNQFKSLDSFGLPKYLENALGQQTEYQYDMRFQQPKKITDANNFSQTIEYSPLGYVKKRTDPLGVEQLTQRFYCSANTCPTGAYYGVRTLVTHPDTPAFGAEPVITHFNKQHQVIAKDVRVFNGDTIRQQMSYYPSGLLHKKSNSFIVGGASESNKRWDEYDYDEQRRVKKIKYANGGEQTFSYNVINGSSIGLSEWSKLQKITQITKVIIGIAMF